MSFSECYVCGELAWKSDGEGMLCYECARKRMLLNYPQPMPKAKIGRNSPCPCGSEKKYKKCCGGV